MNQVGAYFFTNHSLSDSVRGWADPSKLDSIAYPHDSQIIEDVSPQITVTDVQVDLVNHNSLSQSGKRRKFDTTQ